MRRLKKILGAAKEIQVVYPKNTFWNQKNIIFNNKIKSAYLLKERSLVTGRTQISGLEEEVEKYFKAQSK